MIATQKGLVVYNPFTKQIIRYLHDAKVNGSISQNSVYSIYQDNRGSMWIGTYFGGVNQLSNYSTPFYSLINQIKAPDYLFNYVTSGLEQDNAGNLWVGTEDGGLFKISMATGGTNQFLNDPRNTRTIGSNNIKTVLKDKDGNIWIGTHGGG
ncbi:ligand-binding sensor domain-containing protein [Niabella hibiscisoli]|uniref:ligand-binding sensor domain-containing protein n=1 Tax=Niabella hibiscisoli TaxID=1825928 RepID=UPI001F1070D5|nr:two-component regulator propeller domain-containing protein [Niabella hibiscisoli]MCH5718371.1 hypothetical protein [Niabella hibiscisoli]